MKPFKLPSILCGCFLLISSSVFALSAPLNVINKTALTVMPHIADYDSSLDGWQSSAAQFITNDQDDCRDYTDFRRNVIFQIDYDIYF